MCDLSDNSNYDNLNCTPEITHSHMFLRLRGYCRLHSPNHHDDEIQQVPAVPQVRIRVTQQPVCNNFQKCFHRKNDQKEILHPFLDRQNGDKEDISSLIASALISLSIKPLEALKQHQKMYRAICLDDILLQIRPIRKEQISHTQTHRMSVHQRHCVRVDYRAEMLRL